MGMARAAGFNYEGFSSYKGYGDDMRTRGALLNFSFGGPKDYKKNASLQDMFEASLTRKQKTAIGMGIVSFIIFLVITHDDDDECRTSETRITASDLHFLNMILAVTGGKNNSSSYHKFKLKKESGQSG